MSEGKGLRNKAIPEGFTWDHSADAYRHPDGRLWNPNNNEIFDPKTREYSGYAQTTQEHVNSTSDLRTVNNNVMRHNYRVLSDAEKVSMTQIKDAGAAFHSMCDSLGSSRELSLAKTKIEEAVMWAVKHLTK